MFPVGVWLLAPEEFNVNGHALLDNDAEATGNPAFPNTLPAFESAPKFCEADVLFENGPGLFVKLVELCGKSAPPNTLPAFENGLELNIGEFEFWLAVNKVDGWVVEVGNPAPPKTLGLFCELSCAVVLEVAELRDPNVFEVFSCWLEFTGNEVLPKALPLLSSELW
jgi:hypothetical protein